MTIACRHSAAGGSGYAGVGNLKLRFESTFAVEGNIDVALVRHSMDLEKLVSVDPGHVTGNFPAISLNDTDFDPTSCVVPRNLAPGAAFIGALLHLKVDSQALTMNASLDAIRPSIDRKVVGR